MSNPVDKATHGTILHGAAQLLLAVSGYLVAVILARGLGAVNYGVYGVIYSFLMAVELITLWGIPGAVSRLTAEGRDGDGRLRATGLGLVVVLCLLAFAVLWLLAPFLAGWLGVPQSTALLRIAVIDVPCFGSYFLIAHILNGQRDFVGQSAGVCIYALTKVVGSLALLWLGLTIRGALIVNILASLAGLSWVLVRTGRPTLALQMPAVRPILALAAPVAIIALGTQLLLNLDLWMLGYFNAGVGQSTGGYYAAAKNLARFPNLIAFVMNAVLIPSIAHAIGSGDAELARRLIRGSMRFLALTLVPACALVATEAAPLLKLLFSADYAGGAHYLQLLVLANGLLQTLCSTLITILVASRHQRAGAAAAVIAVVPAIVLYAILIPWLGAGGAALGALLSAALAVLVAALLTYRLVGPFIEISMLLRVLLVSAVVCALASVMPASGVLLLLELAAMAVIFYLLCLVAGVLTPDDISQLRNRITPRRR